ncbi:MAG TPA: cache domain-containing protein, partial [Prolixibacteraceae bacterium]|nr:cache domain-containing protein [Prolixibacteraceae bacterium]
MNIKKFIRNKGLALKLILYIFTSIAIIFFLIFIYNYNISKKIVQRNLITNAKSITAETVLRVENVLGSVQKIPLNFSKLIESSNLTIDEMIGIVKQEVANNPEIYGAALAFEPYSIEPSKKYFSPYFYRKGDSIAFKNIGDEAYDYFSMDWYQIPKQLNKPMWSEPYYDEGAGNALMSTFSVPIYKTINGKREFIAILT